MNRSLAAAALAVLTTLTACSGVPTAHSVPSAAEPASVRHAEDVLGGVPQVHLKLCLFDAPMPGAGIHVNVALTAIDLVSSSGAVVPFATYAKPNVVDLLSLQKAPLPVNGAVPPGTYTSLQFSIDLADSNITIGPMKLPLAMPNGPTSLVADAPVSVTVVAGQPLILTADFNVLQSFSLSGGKVSIHPSILATVNGGTIRGKVVDAAGKPVSSATVEAVSPGGAVANVTASATDGSFILHALPAGGYTIVVLNSYATAAGDVLTASGNDPNAAPTATASLAAGADLDLGKLTD